MDTKQYREDRATDSHLVTGMAFLAENPEAYGLVPDACPVVTSDLLLAVNGHRSTGGAISPTYPVEAKGVDGILDTLYGSLIPRTDENAHLLRSTFGESEGMQEHPVARYCAVLAESVAFRILSATTQGTAAKQVSFMLGEEIPQKLDRLRETVCFDGVTPRDDDLFSVSLGACRVHSKGEGRYGVDIFSAGDFCVYMLDGQGLHPLWLADTPVLRPENSSSERIEPACRSVELVHPEPFALLLLSEGLSDLSATELRALRENPGLIWRYRMRLEDQILRIITSCVREQEFGERAARFFTGRSHGRDSASGAMMILRDGFSYEVFRSICQTRLTRLEDMISLMPEGYDPVRVPISLPREEMEVGHLHRLLEREHGLPDRVTEAVRVCALNKLKQGKDGETTPPPADVPAYRRLSLEEIHTVFRRYDVENDADRAQVAENRHILRENLTDHWVLLRPYFLRLFPQLSPDGGGETAKRCYTTCADMHAHLSRMLASRKETLARLDSLLSDSLTVLRADGKDWLSGRAGDGSAAAWSRGLRDELPNALLPMLTVWQEETDRYRSLMSAYTYEREQLFRMDAETPDGFFAADWQRILNGNLTDERWAALATCLAGDQFASYRELLKSLRRVSMGTGALLARMEGRGAERRMAREFAGRSDIQIAALRASAYEDEDWGESVVTVMDPALRREHKDAVRRWQENRELAARRAEAYAAYSSAWNAYLTPEREASSQ